MLQFPFRSRFVIVTDLKRADATNRRPPRQFADDFTPIGEWIEVYAMLFGPAAPC